MTISELIVIQTFYAIIPVPLGSRSLRQYCKCVFYICVSICRHRQVMYYCMRIMFFLQVPIQGQALSALDAQRFSNF